MKRLLLSLCLWFLVAAPIQSNAEAAPPGVDSYRDPLDTEALARFGTVRFRHGPLHLASYFSACFSRDSRLLASTMELGLIRVWESATGKELVRIRAKPWHQWRVLDIAPSGRLVAASSALGVTLWELPSGRCSATLRAEPEQRA